MYLLDTNVVSELRRTRPHVAVMEWLRSTGESPLYIAAVTMGEIQAGIEITRSQDATKAAELEAWADMIMESHTVLAMDGETFRLWARLMHRKSDQLYEDAMIAATALRNRLTVATRNTKDFEAFDVAIVNPFEY